MTTAIVIFACFFLLIAGAPIFVVICGLTLLLLAMGQINVAAIVIEMQRMATTPVLVAIPLFTFAGYVLSESGAPKRLIRLSDAVLGWMPGGAIRDRPDKLRRVHRSYGSDGPDDHRPRGDTPSSNDRGAVPGTVRPGGS